ncbi:MAG: antigen-like protein [Fibrobacteria bacterium]|nr:antigen-like protein [Fibrobacteria bacterium]
MRIPIALAVCLAATSALPYVGQWHAYTDKTHVTSLIEHNGFVYAGTTGGIRRLTPAAGSMAQVEYDNLDGLLDVSIKSLLRDADGVLWAVAFDGYLYTLRGSRWEVSGRSYAALGWKMNDRAALAAGPYFYLGSLKGLTVFDTRKKISQLNVTRFRDETDVSVLSLLPLEDTLYVGTTRGVYKIAVYFADPLNPPAGGSYPNLADPNAWVQVSSAIGHSLAMSGDSVVARGPGTLIEAPLRVEAFLDTPLVVGAHAYAGWKDFTTALVTGGRVFAGGESGLAVSQNPAGAAADAQLLAPLTAHSRDTIFNLGAHGGTIWGHSPTGLHKLSGSGEFLAVNTGIPYIPELLTRHLRNVKVDAGGAVYVGTWGHGLTRFRNGALDRWTQGTNPCIFQAFPPDNPWTVAMAISSPRNGGLYFSVFRTEGSGDHQLVYFDLDDGTISCPEAGLLVDGGYAHAVHAFSDTLLGVATNDGVSFFKTRQGLSGTLLEPKGKWTVKGGSPEGWDLAADRWGRPWVTFGSNLGSLDLDSLDISTSGFLDGAEGFSGEDCRSLESDAAGVLWLGCANGLFQVTTGIAGDISAVRRYGMDDGLLSLRILDLSVDPVTGRVWIATDRGVSMLEGAGQTAVPNGSLAAVTPYPNPFKPGHRFVIFDNLPRNSTLRILDGTGHVVKIFHPRDLTGNQAQWDGKNQQGTPVSAGVYLFSVVSGSKVQRGKVIVAR